MNSNILYRSPKLSEIEECIQLAMNKVNFLKIAFFEKKDGGISFS